MNSQSPTTVRPAEIPARFNAARELLEANLRAGREARVAIIDDAGRYTYAGLAERAGRFAEALGRLGVRREQRILLCLQDTVDFPSAFLGAIAAGVVPVAVNTLLRGADYAYMLNDCRAAALVVSRALLPELAPVRGTSPWLRHAIVTGAEEPPQGWLALPELLASSSGRFEAADTARDEPCFWLYSSGSTGAPKGTVHVHASLLHTAALYGQGVLGMTADDLVFSAAKLFFAYGLGNALSFPLSVGATALLMAERPTPQAVIERLETLRPTIFCGVPTLYAAMLASGLLGRAPLALRRCTSAGEALPPEIGRRWQEATGVEILDGIGSTEMLHIFMANRPDAVRPGTLGRPVPGYEACIRDERGQEVAPGETGDLYVRGPSAALGYWNQLERSRATFQGEWVRTGDKFRVDEQGDYVFAGRSDDMLKVGGIYVSPIEIEAALAAHPAVLEAAVVGAEDAAGLVKPLACIVLGAGRTPSDDLARELQQFVKQRLAPYKYPHWIEFVAELPKTATGKIQRFRLRERHAAARQEGAARG